MCYSRYAVYIYAAYKYGFMKKYFKETYVKFYTSLSMLHNYLKGYYMATYYHYTVKSLNKP